MSPGRLWTVSGIAGVVGVACYILAIAVPWPETQWGTSAALLVVCAWPILSIVYSYGLYSYVADERDGAINRLGFVFAVAAFATVLAMIVVQLAVGAGSARSPAGSTRRPPRRCGAGCGWSISGSTWRGTC